MRSSFKAYTQFFYIVCIRVLIFPFSLAYLRALIHFSATHQARRTKMIFHRNFSMMIFHRNLSMMIFEVEREEGTRLGNIKV